MSLSVGKSVDLVDYEPLNLSSFCNVGTEILGKGEEAPVGFQHFHGLPFLVGSYSASGPTLTAFGSHEGQLDGAHVPIERNAEWVIVAHAMLETNLFAGGAIGSTIANYVFHYTDRPPERAQIRERFEIAITPSYRANKSLPLDWGQYPFLAVPEAEQTLMPRTIGRYDETGMRLGEIYDPQAREPYVIPYTYYLWPWRNPYPSSTLSHIEIVPAGGQSFCIAAITLSHLKEEPFARTVANDVIFTLPNGGVDEELEVDVDRGTTSYPQPLVLSEKEGTVEEEMPGWGQGRKYPCSSGYVKVSATPSATLSIRRGGEVFSRVNWGELQHWGELQSSSAIPSSPAVEFSLGTRIAILEGSCNWVHTTVIDADTGQPIPCRIHFRSVQGVPYAPYGHRAHINSEMGTWNLDVGGDVRLGAKTYAYIDGRCQGWLPRGEIIVEVAKGFEYEPVQQRVYIKPDQRELTIQLQRITDMAAERYFSGDTHVHFISTQGGHLEAQGEDLRVLNLLLSQWGHMFSSTEEFTGQPSLSENESTIVYASQENRQNVLGHLTLLGLEEPVMPWCTGGPEEAEMGGGLQTTLSHWADECHAQGGTVILPHFPIPNGEVATLIATGRADAAEMVIHDYYNDNEYYRYLNCGYKLPLVGGTDKMTAEVPVGLFRTYTFIPPDREFTYRNWCDGIRSGNTFLSSGPLLKFTVDGQPIGSTVQLREDGGTIEVEAHAQSIFPIQSLQIVAGGQVVTEVVEDSPVNKLHLKTELQLENDTWLAARCSGPGYQGAKHHDTWRREVVAHTSPVYVSCGPEYERFDPETARYMLSLIEGSLSFIRDLSSRFWPGDVTHHHKDEDHLAFLEKPFEEAKQALQSRALRHNYEL